MVKYQKYKEINLPWLKIIPANWDIKRNKQFLHERKKIVGNKSSEYTLLSLTLRGIVVRDLSENKGKMPASFDNYKIVEPGDIAFCLFDIDETPRTVGLSKYKGMLTGAYNIFHIEGINARYLYYYYLALDNIKGLRPLYTGLRKTINVNTFLSQQIPVPPRAEQDQIVRFLDWKVSEINKKISLKRQSLELLKELVNSAFATLISSAFEKVRLKRVASLESDYIEINPDDYYKKAGMYNRGRGIFLRDPIKGAEMGDSKFQRIHSDRLMISGQFAWEDAVYVTSLKDEEGVASHRYYLLKSINHDVPVEFLFGYFLSQKGFSDLKQCSHGSAGRNRPLNINELLRIEVPIVHDHEAVSKLCNLVHAYMAMRPIVLHEEAILGELRNRIISDVVTGKIDVRNVTVPEYEHVDDICDDNSESDEESDETEMDEEV